MVKQVAAYLTELATEMARMAEEAGLKTAAHLFRTAALDTLQELAAIEPKAA